MGNIVQILHIEDDRNDAELVKSKLIDGGILCDITCVQDQTAFAEALGRKEFDLIISDYTLPSF